MFSENFYCVFSFLFKNNIYLCSKLQINVINHKASYIVVNTCYEATDRQIYNGLIKANRDYKNIPIRFSCAFHNVVEI